MLNQAKQAKIRISGRSTNMWRMYDIKLPNSEVRLSLLNGQVLNHTWRDYILIRDIHDTSPHEATASSRSHKKSEIKSKWMMPDYDGKAIQNERWCQSMLVSPPKWEMKGGASLCWEVRQSERSGARSMLVKPQSVKYMTTRFDHHDRRNRNL